MYRNIKVTFRVSDNELVELKNKVKESGITLQSYLLQASLEEHLVDRAELVKLQEISTQLNDIDKQLRGMGTNINQLARKANTYNELPSIESLEQLYDEVISLRKEADDIWQLIRSRIAKV